MLGLRRKEKEKAITLIASIKTNISDFLLSLFKSSLHGMKPKSHYKEGRYLGLGVKIVLECVYLSVS